MGRCTRARESLCTNVPAGTLYVHRSTCTGRHKSWEVARTDWLTSHRRRVGRSAGHGGHPPQKGAKEQERPQTKNELGKAEFVMRDSKLRVSCHGAVCPP